ncbi:MAG: arylsulfatase, partial [Planctomycetaceae bacterium]|nr:arylsulfatase [Planctomycetaceae bacterium]
RSGQWKLHRYDRKTARNVVVEKELTNTKVQQFQLYDLKADPGETTNIIDKHPDLAEQLKKKLAQLIEAP